MAEPINAGLLNPFFNYALENAWSRETCWPGCIEGYDEKNPSYGNCFVSVLAAWADGGFKDKIVGGKVDESAWHFRLERDGKAIDPTWQQFPDGSIFRALGGGTPEAREEFRTVITGSLEDPSLEPRLQKLLAKMEEQSGYKTKHKAADICSRLCESFAFVYAPEFVGGPRVASGGPRPLG